MLLRLKSANGLDGDPCRAKPKIPDLFWLIFILNAGWMLSCEVMQELSRDVRQKLVRANPFLELLTVRDVRKWADVRCVASNGCRRSAPCWTALQLSYGGSSASLHQRHTLKPNCVLLPDP